MTVTLSPAQQKALTLIETTGQAQGVKSRTLKALEKRELIRRTASGYERAPVKEILSPTTQTTYRIISRRWSITPTVDINLPDAEFWDKARNGKAMAMQLAGALLKPVQSKIAAWVFGIMPKFKFEDDYTQGEFMDWFNQVHPELLRGYEESVGLGNEWITVNPDMSVTIVPPDVVDPIVDEMDYSKIVGWKVTEVYPHPERPGDTMTIEDVYSEKERTRTILKNGTSILSTTYKNLIGVLPIAHVKNNAGVNERNGKPEAAALYPILSEYDDVLHNAITGNKLMGQPTPVFEEMGTPKQVDAFMAEFGEEETYVDTDGTTKRRVVFNFDPKDAQVIGGSGKFNYKSPNPFMADVTKLLEILYYLFIEHLELPEFIMGTAIASSKASVETQMPAFEKFIQKKQGLMRYWLQQIVEIALRYMALFDSKIKVEQPKISFVPLTTKDGKLTIEAAKLAAGRGLLTKEALLRVLPLDIDDPAQAVKDADEEAAAAADAFEQNMDKELERAEQRLNNEDKENDDTVDTDDEEDEDTRTDEMVNRLLVGVEI
jgi:hypothetical protein